MNDSTGDRHAQAALLLNTHADYSAAVLTSIATLWRSLKGRR